MKKRISFPAVLSIAAAALIAMSSYVNNTLKNGIFIDNKGEPTLTSAGLTAEVKQGRSEISSADIKLFGIIPLKTVTAVQEQRPYLIPCGSPFGLKLLTDGVIVTDFGKVGEDGGDFELSPAGKAGLKAGDIITEVNGEKITSSKQLSELIAKSPDKATITYIRDGAAHTADIVPEADSQGNYKIGVWVRDSTAGIGTMTYYDSENKVFAGLGHAVCDIDTGEVLPLRKGEIVPATITEVKKGMSGVPGELGGSLMSNTVTGRIGINSERGLFGYSSLCPVSADPIPMAYAEEVKPGKAYILTTVSDCPPQKYEIEIESVDPFNRENKNMVIRVTDKELLSITGGIVQGMSGSPIIQDNMLVGAVTHVFVNEPERGYAIFAQNMYNEAEQLNSYSQRLRDAA